MTEISNTPAVRKVGIGLGIGILLIPFIFVWFLLRNGHSKISKIVGFSWLGIALIITLMPKNHQTADNSISTTTQTEQAQKAPMPANQSAFIQAVTSSIGEYRSAQNELKKSAVRTKRSDALASALGNNRIITDWVGTLKTLKTTKDGKAYITIVLDGSDHQVKTWNNALSDMMDKTLIDQNTELFKVLAEMDEGQTVKFSGSFLKGDQDFIKEGSVSESGSMLDPEFLVKFKSVERM